MSPSTSSSSASSVSIRNTMRLPTLGKGSKPQISIHLNEARNTFTTLDKIAGTVVITTSTNTRFDQLEIQFLGVAKTFIEKLQTTPGLAQTQTAFHNFLKLTQPISESAYPQPRILEAGRTYEFPFLFVVPQQLLPRVCNHKVQHEFVRDLHIQVPPSLGGHGNYEGSGSRLDDFAPAMAEVGYHITARIQDETSRVITLQTKAVDIIPSSDEQPPVNVDGLDSDYYLRMEKTIKKGLFKGKLGSFIMEADQPKSLRMSANHSQTSAPVSTSTTIRLRFDPSDNHVSPPRLASLSSKFKISTWYADQGRTIVPNKKSIQYDLHQGMHSEFISLPSRSMENVEWTFHKEDQTPTLNRRDSGLSSFSSSDKVIPAASGKYRGNGFYTAEIMVPVTLPTNKRFVPTFHSCLISRTYGLYLNLSLQGSPVTSPSVELKVPIQVSIEGTGADTTSSPRSSLTVEEQIEEARIADEFFVAHTFSPMEQSRIGGSNIPCVASFMPSDLPPHYEGLSHVGRGFEVKASG